MWSLRTFVFKQLPLNDNEKCFDEKLNYKNYKRTVRKLHDTGWKDIYFTSAYVDMIGHVYGVSMYLQFYIQHLENHQVLPHTYLGSFKGGNG